jgi:hypothetical protein
MGYWAVYKITAGKVVEKYMAWKSGKPGGKRAGRVKGASTVKKMEANMAGAIRQAARTLNANFSAADVLMTLNYDDEHLPESWEEHEKDRELMLRRINKRLARMGLPAARWLSVCADRDGKTGRAERRHIHVVLSGEGMTYRDGAWRLGGESLTEIWGKGRAWCEQLYDQEDYTALAAYLIRQARSDKADWKKYHTSRNLERPQPEEEIRLTGRQLRPPRGAVVCENHYDARNGSNYIRYIRPAARRPGRGDGENGLPRRAGGPPRNDGGKGDGENGLPRACGPRNDGGKGGRT